MKNSNIVLSALLYLGRSKEVRSEFIDFLIKCEKKLTNIENIRDRVTGPLVDYIHSEDDILQKTIKNGLVFEFFYNSKIAREFVMSDEKIPDHVWEPQTTRVLRYFSKNAKNVIVGGAFFGDQTIIIANQMKGSNGICHAFEPNPTQFNTLNINIDNNNLNNIVVNRTALWSEAGKFLNIGKKNNVVDNENSNKPFLLTDEGNFSVKSSSDIFSENDNNVESITIDRYIENKGIGNIDLIMLDLEGSEINALIGAEAYLKSSNKMPTIVFEIHKLYENWDHGLENTKIFKFLKGYGYKLFAIRDYQGNVCMAASPIELIPSNKVYLKGPPHGFNILAIQKISQLDDRFVFCENVSPKLLKNRDPSLFQPIN